MDQVFAAADGSSSTSRSASLIPSNVPLLSAFLAFALAQFLKIFTTWFKEKRWDARRLVRSGGMPSSHSSTVTALAVAIGLQEGAGSPAFAVAVVLACVVMYDATGVRLHAGRQAELLNQIVCELPPEHPVSNVRPLRDSLGHTPLQMTETLSPRQRAAAMSNRLHSPTRPFFLDSNNDELERAQSRAARAVAIRRKAAAIPEHPPPDDPCLSSEQIVELFQNCIKLASENKINQKNTWELKLIDHLSEIIKVETVGDSETNFQKASCTLEAGVKIYSVRVDSLHAEAYKVLGGINRVGQEHEQETTTVCNNVDNGQDGGYSKKESERKISPLSTLESSFEALNVKKFDVAFAVDPLYHQTSAQFDEGGAKGLLLNNLGVYGGCRVLFDSFEVPGKCNSYPLQNNTSDMIDISFITEFTGQMVTNMRTMSEISPTLKEIICHFDEDNQRSQTVNLGEKFDSREDSLNASPEAFNDVADAFDANDVGLDDNSFGNCEAWRFDQGGEACFVNESFGSGPTFNGHYEENDPYAAYEPDVEDRFEDVTMFLFQGLEFTSKRNAWAGPDHWNFWKFKGSDKVSTGKSGPVFSPKRQKKRTNAEVGIEFMKSLDKEVFDIFATPKSLKSLLLPAKRAPCIITLPEDCHYQPENLVKLFLLPNILCTGKRRRKFSGSPCSYFAPEQI